VNPRIPEPSESTAEQIDLAADRRALTAGIRLLSAGNVVEIPPNGPVLKGRQASPRFFSPDTFVPTLRRSDRILAAGLTVGWLVCVGWFWLWWLEPEHRVNWVGLLVSSTLLCYLTCEPISFMVAVNRLRHVDPRSSIPNLRCAFVVTRAPSEPWEVARTTLSAMLAQEFPHGYDVWLCDEQPTAEVIGWCAGHNVRISTRSGVGAYHRREWPRRTRCKEGNLAYFYDHTGYENYDVVAQLDCDHVPVPGYLAEMVRPFADPAIGYVAAPSVCDANAASSWSARGRVHREAYFHGAVQLGHSSGLAPICVGSHYAVRTKAVRDIGGIGPELLEDFSTSFLLNSAGWQGAFAIAAEAHGNGPLTVSAMLVQEFQWTRSLSTLLYRVVPPHLGRLAWRLRLRFVYSLLFHTALIATIVCGLVLPAIAAVTGVSWVNVSYLGFGLHWWSISIWIVALTMLLRRRGLLRPVRAPILSWENWLYRLTRWPFIAWGVCAAAVALFRPRPITFKVTPKAADGLEPLPPKVIAPYVTISVVLAGAALVGELSTTAAGWVFLCLLGAAVYAVVTFAVCFLHAVEASRSAGVGLARAIAETVRAPLLISALTIPFVTGGIVLYPGYASGVFGW
jgi:cellulose synthase/poly-beta-1,6-N-acetylglucosamine synthase-like glycosyltransferase